MIRKDITFADKNFYLSIIKRTMRQLSPEYVRLVKMRYVLNTQDIADINDLNASIDNLTISKNRLVDISENIATTINEWKGNSPCIGATTLGRMFGVYSSNGDISRSNCDRIAKYIGYKDWYDIIGRKIEDIEANIIKNNSLKLEQEMVSRGYDNTRHYLSNAISRLLARDVLAGTMLDITYGNQKVLRLRKLKDEFRYMVEYCDSKVLTQGMCLSIPVMFVGAHILGFDVTENKQPVKSYYKSGGDIKEIRIVYA